MAIKSKQRGGADSGRGDDPYTANYRTTFESMPTPKINTPMVSFEQPQEQQQRGAQQMFINPQDIPNIAFGQFMPDLNPYT